MAGVRRVLVLAALSMSVGGVAALMSPASAQVSPSMTVAPSTARVGSTVVVSARNFPPLIQNLQVAVCGNQAAGGSADCDESAARNFATGTGDFQIKLVVTLPPVPCPCAVAAYAPSLGAPVIAPFTVIGAPVAPVVPAPHLQSNLVINQVRLVGSNSLGAWFGAAPERTLLLTVTNTGNVAAVSPPLVLKIGKGPSPSDNVAAPDLGSLAPAATRTYQIPVDFPVLSHGSYMLLGQLGTAGQASGFTTRMSSWPWGLIAVVIVLIQLTLLWIRNRIRDVIWMAELRRSIAAAPVAEGSAPHDLRDTARQPEIAPADPSESPNGRTAATKAALAEGVTRGRGADSTDGEA